MWSQDVGGFSVAEMSVQVNKSGCFLAISDISVKIISVGLAEPPFGRMLDKGKLDLSVTIFEFGSLHNLVLGAHLEFVMEVDANRMSGSKTVFVLIFNLVGKEIVK